MWWNKERHSTLKGLAAGAIAGAVGSFAMNRSQAAMSKIFEPPPRPEKQENSDQAQGWKEQREPQHGGDTENATVKAAVAVSETVFHHELPREKRQPAGNAMHYAFGTATGALYGVAAEHWSGIRAGHGTALGAAVWLTADEIGVPSLGFSKPPQAYPLRTHAMALGAHLVYGVTAELVRRLLRAKVITR